MFADRAFDDEQVIAGIPYLAGWRLTPILKRFSGDKLFRNCSVVFKYGLRSVNRRCMIEPG